MLVVSTIAEIRPAHFFVGKLIKQVCRVVVAEYVTT